MRWRPLLTVLVTSGLLAAGAVAPTQGDAAAAAALPPIAPTRAPYPAGGNVVIGEGNDVANQNAQLTDSMPATVTPSWRNAPPLCPQSGGVSASSISVTAKTTIVTEPQYQCSSVSAYATTTGKLVWRKQYHFAIQATVTRGTVYLLHDDPATSEYRVDALSADTGKRIWAGDLVNGEGGWAVSVGNGHVSNGAAVSSSRTGTFLWRARWDVGTPVRSIISGGRVYVWSPNGVTATDSKGNWLWRTLLPDLGPSPAQAESRASASVHDGLLYVPGARTFVIDTKTGKILRKLPSSYQSVAFDGRTGFFTSNGWTPGSVDGPSVAATVRAVDLTTGTVRWTHSFPMKGSNPWNPDTAPLVSNGLVWLSSTSDSLDPTTVVALDEVSGAQRNEFVAACSDGGGGGNLAIAQHRLFVSTACGVQTYVPSRTTPASTTPGEVLTDPGFERGTDGWAAMGSSTLARSTTPARTGHAAVTIVPSGSAAGTVGATRTVSTNAQRHAWFEASCWVRPSTAGVSVAFRSREWSPSDPPSTPTTPLPQVGTGGWDVAELTTGVWTRLDTTGYVQDAGDSLALQITSRNAAGVGGTITVDDCTVTGTQPSS